MKMNQFEKGFYHGQFWGAAEALRLHGDEVMALDMLGGIGKCNVEKCACDIDLEELRKEPRIAQRLREMELK